MCFTGFVFLMLGFFNLYKNDRTKRELEELIIGGILFIPGFYHTILAIQALRQVDGWGFEDLQVFQNENIFG